MCNFDHWRTCTEETVNRDEAAGVLCRVKLNRISRGIKWYFTRHGDTRGRGPPPLSSSLHSLPSLFLFWIWAWMWQLVYTIFGLMGSPRGMPGNDENNYYPRSYSASARLRNDLAVVVARIAGFMCTCIRWPSRRPSFRSWILTGRAESLPSVVTELAKPEFTCFADKNSENIVIHPDHRVISSVLRRVSLTRFTTISRSPSLPTFLSTSHPVFFFFLSFSFFPFSISSPFDSVLRRKKALLSKINVVQEEYKKLLRNCF